MPQKQEIIDYFLMTKVILHPARNGVIKKVIDENHGGSNESKSTVDVYEHPIDKSNDINYIKRFFYDICEDLGLHIGNKFDKEVLKIQADWGSHYEPTQKEIDLKIKELEAELNLLKEWKKQ